MDLINTIVGMGVMFGLFLGIGITVFVIWLDNYYKAKRKLIARWLCPECKKKYEFARRMGD